MAEPMDVPNRRKTKTRMAFVVVLAVIAGGVGYHWWWSRTHVISDNAQIEGHLIPIAARVGGYVLKVPVTDNQYVGSGGALVEIDPRDYIVKVAQAEADYAQTQAAAGTNGQLGQALAQIGAAQANATATGSQAAAIVAQISEAQANVDKARRDLQRTRELANQKMVSPSALDAAETTLRGAEARVLALQAQLKTAHQSATAASQQVGVSSAGLKMAQAKVMATESALQLARNQLTDTHVAAPGSGVVSKKSVEPGQMISAGQTLMYLIPADQLWVTANLKETELQQIRVGQPVEIGVDAYPDILVKGHVDSFSPATGARFTLLPPDNATGNFTKVVQRVPVKITIDALPAGGLLRPGLSVSVVISTRKAD